MNNISSNQTQLESSKKPEFQGKPGDITIFSIKEKKEGSNDFWGRLIDNNGELKSIILYLKKSQKEDSYLAGYVAGSAKELEHLTSNVDSKLPNTIILFLNKNYVAADLLLAGEKPKPYYTGFYINEFGIKQDVALWLKIGKSTKNEFFSGVLKESSQPVNTIADIQNHGSKPGDDAPF